jgi:hypothetical protein
LAKHVPWQPRELAFIRDSTTTSLTLLLIKRTCFFYLIKAFLGFIKDLFFTSKAFNAIISIVLFFFYACFLAFSFTFTLLIFSFLTTNYNAFTAFLASFLALFLAYIAFLISIYILFNFLNAFFFFFLTIYSYVYYILKVKKSINNICSLPNIFNLFL